jgi:FG-GAP-like repeat
VEPPGRDAERGAVVGAFRRRYSRAEYGAKTGRKCDEKALEKKIRKSILVGMSDSSPRRTAGLVLASGLWVGCGPGLGSGDGSGSASAGTEGSGSSDDAASHEATGSPDVGASGPDCSRSDLSEPFCHELVVYEPFGWVVGVLDEVRNGVRPLVVSGEDEEEGFGLRLVNPLNPDDVLAEVPPPLTLEWGLTGKARVITADFTGDGMSELALWADTPDGERQVAVLAGRTLETIAFRDEFGGYALRVGALDLDGDGVDELITGEVDDPGVTVSAWSVENGELTLRASEFIGVGCEGWWFTRGDYDGDGRRDLAMVWLQYCEDYFQLKLFGPPQIITLLGGSAPKSGLGLRYALQPASMEKVAAGDFDGDGDHELLIGQSEEPLTLVDWVSGGFAEAGSLATGDSVPTYVATLRSGRFSVQGPDGVLVGPLVRYAEDGSPDYSHGAIFPNGTSVPGVVELPYDVVRVGDFDVDLNADGITDFHTTVDGSGGAHGIYLSIR